MFEKGTNIYKVEVNQEDHHMDLRVCRYNSCKGIIDKEDIEIKIQVWVTITKNKEMT